MATERLILSLIWSNLIYGIVRKFMFKVNIFKTRRYYKKRDIFSSSKKPCQALVLMRPNTIFLSIILSCNRLDIWESQIIQAPSTGYMLSLIYIFYVFIHNKHDPVNPILDNNPTPYFHKHSSSTSLLIHKYLLGVIREVAKNITKFLINYTFTVRKLHF